MLNQVFGFAGKSIRSSLKPFVLFVVCFFSLSQTLQAQTTGFTYQGKLADAGAPATGPYDLVFKLFPIVSGGAQIGADVVSDDVQVTTGVFTVSLDFGSSPFTSDTARYLEIAVRPGASTGAYTTLVPRQPITSSPYSVSTIRAASADVATNALQLGGVTASQFVQTTDARLSDARPPAAGSKNYIQNTTAPQASTNFNISGSGTANILNAATQYNIGGNRVLSNSGIENLFAGVTSGESNTSGSDNSFFGIASGQANTSGGDNSFFGSYAGRSNTTGNLNSYFGVNAGANTSAGASNSFFGFATGLENTASSNSFFGSYSGSSNTSGQGNAFFGFESGQRNTTGGVNSFFGQISGQANTTGGANSFFGGSSGLANTTGGFNSFLGTFSAPENTSGSFNTVIGASAARSNTTGTDNTFLGYFSGASNTIENNNTFIGKQADGNPGITHATAIGANAVVTQSNSLVLGSINGANGSTVDTNVGIGTTAPQARLHVNGIIRVDVLGAAGSTQLCLNAANQVSTCSSSLRYKTNIKPFSNGLNFITLLRPIAFSWKDGGLKDVGFGAEDVARISPLLVTYNAKGEIEGVKYDRLSVIFVNAFKEQQLQLDRKDAEIQTLQSENVALNARLSRIERMMQEFKTAPAAPPERPGLRRSSTRRHQPRSVSR